MIEKQVRLLKKLLILKKSLIRTIFTIMVLIILHRMFFTESDLRQRPFISEVWGNVADWAMVVVTGFTLYYLVKTFNSQTEVQRLQTKATMIENERYRREFMPKFEVDIETHEPLYNARQWKIPLKIILKLVNSHILHCHFKITCDNANIFEKTGNVYDGFNIEMNALHDVSFNIEAEDELYRTNGANVIVTMHFTDPVKNKYRQESTIILSSGSNRIGTDETPTLIEF